MVHSEGCFNLFPGKYRGNKCTATSVNMFIARNTYEVAILAYFEQIGLEKRWGGPPHSSYSRGNTAAMTQKINNTMLKKVDIHIMNAWIFSEGMCCWHHNNFILSFPTFALTRQPHIFMFDIQFQKWICVHQVIVITWHHYLLPTPLPWCMFFVYWNWIHAFLYRSTRNRTMLTTTSSTS